MGKKWKQWQTFIFLGSKITADGDCSHEIKRLLLLGRKAMMNLDSILKSKDITLPTKIHIVKLQFFQWSCTDVRVGPQRRLSAEELMLLNCGAGEDSWETLGQQRNQTCQSLRKPTLNIYWKDWCWSWIRIDAGYHLEATWCEKPTHWKRPWCWERLRAG